MIKTLHCAAVLFALFVIALGAYARLTDAGLGCPDWPGCYGQLTVPTTESAVEKAELKYPERPVVAYKAFNEMIHRYAVSVLSLLIVAMTSIALWQRFRQKRVVSLWPYGLLLMTLAFQAALGMWTVTLKLFPPVVMGHLLGGFLTLVLLWWIFLEDLTFQRVAVTRGQRCAAVFGLTVVVLQIALGGWTSSNYASWSCAGFPMCNGQWLPTLDFSQAFNFFQTLGPDYEGGLLDNTARVTIQFSHRVFAMVVLGAWSGVVAWLVRVADQRIRPLLKVILMILVLQLTLGVLNVWLAPNILIAVFHNLGAAVLLLAAISLNYVLFRCHD